jgi:hypothetical protein
VSLSADFKYVLEGQTSFPDACMLICTHVQSQMKADVDVLRHELVDVKQGTDSVAAFLHKVTT